MSTSEAVATSGFLIFTDKSDGMLVALRKDSIEQVMERSESVHIYYGQEGDGEYEAAECFDTIMARLGFSPNDLPARMMEAAE